MNFLRRKQLYRIITTERIEYYPFGFGKYLHIAYTINDSFMGSQKFNYIPEGISGWVIKWLGREWFSPDKAQKGLEHFAPAKSATDRFNVLIPLGKLKGCYLVKDFQ